MTIFEVSERRGTLHETGAMICYQGSSKSDFSAPSSGKTNYIDKYGIEVATIYQ